MDEEDGAISPEVDECGEDGGDRGGGVLVDAAEDRGERVDDHEARVDLLRSAAERLEVLREREAARAMRDEDLARAEREIALDGDPARAIEEARLGPLHLDEQHRTAGDPAPEEAMRLAAADGEGERDAEEALPALRRAGEDREADLGDDLLEEPRGRGDRGADRLGEVAEREAHRRTATRSSAGCGSSARRRSSRSPRAASRCAARVSAAA